MGLPAKTEYKTLKPSGYTAQTWLNRVKSVNEAIAKNNIRTVISPRAAFYGAKLADVLDRETLESGILWKGMSAVQKQQIETSAC
jgi:hypothetical protein